MEVHTHSHTSRKKWSHYFWEFLMLFLAVFCGFLAEYQLEYIIEHNREKQFMRSMAEDLQTDTVELQRAIRKADTVARYSDSVLFFLTSNTPGDEVPLRLARIIGTAGQRLVLINTDRTSSQLKNSGAMRLVRKKKVSDFILRYWKPIEETQISLDRYMIYRDAARTLIFKLWVIPDVYRRGLKTDLNAELSLRVIDKDSKKWDELTNLTAISGSIARNTHLPNLENQLAMSKELIELIKKEYHLE